MSTQFQIISQLPSDSAGRRKLMTLATEEIGETPNAPSLVIATPCAEKNRPKIHNAYRFSVSDEIGME